MNVYDELNLKEDIKGLYEEKGIKPVLGCLLDLIKAQALIIETIAQKLPKEK